MEKKKRQMRLKVLRSGDPRSQFVTSTAKEILERLGRPKFLLSSSSKVRKGESVGVRTKVLYLTSGLFCPSASKGCLASCITSSGYMKEQRAVDARDRRSALFVEDRPAFIELLRTELHEHCHNAETQGLVPAVRLNGTSDIAWEKEHPELFEEFRETPMVWYDYTKRFDRMFDYLAGEWGDPWMHPVPWPRYHLTFSLSERNSHHAEEVLDAGGNVAAVFWPELPESWKGYPVIDGDKYDARFLDEGPAVIGLSAKGFVAREDDLTGFVIRTDESESSLPNRKYAHLFAA